MSRTYVALLRGINVGGRNRLSMADLRTLLAELGHGSPRTYVESGNAVFASERTDVEAIASELAERISADLGVAPVVVVRTAEELAAVAAANPYTEAASADPTTVHAAFLPTGGADPPLLEIDPDAYAPEELTVASGVAYLHLPGGLGRSRLAAEVERRRAEHGVTMRNWRTVSKLLDMVDS